MSKKVKQHKTIVPGNGLAVNVLGTTREDLSYALKTFKRKVKNAGIMDVINRKQEFIKPSVINRAKQVKAEYIQKIKTNNEKD